jgi:hypothetical protein
MPPPILALPESLRPPEINIEALAASAPARILAAVAALETDLLRDDIPG